MNPFAKKPTPREQLRTSKRDLANAARGIEREIGTLELEEKKLKAEIKRTAKSGNNAATKTLALQLVRLRQKITALQKSRAQMRGIATHNQAMLANSSVASAMKGATKATAAVNEVMGPISKQQKLLIEFQQQSAQLDMRSEIISDSLDDVLDDDDVDEETDELTNQVLDEIGIDVGSQMSSAPKHKVAGKSSEDIESLELDLETRLAALRN